MGGEEEGDDDGANHPHDQQKKDDDNNKPAYYKPSGVNVRDFSCVPYADALWWCYTPGNQMKVYYRTGTVDTCLPAFRKLKKCLALQYKAYKDPKAAQQELDASSLNYNRYPRTSVTQGVWRLKEKPSLEPDVDVEVE